MKKDKHWVDDNGTLFFGSIPTVTEKLPNGIYELNQSEMGFYLKRISEEFTIEGKVYGVETEFINRVIKANQELKNNFGILLKGLKGTGKTITAKLICKKLNIPVILVNRSFANLGEFVNNIDQDIIMFFDEFEKIYNLSFDGEDEYDEGGKVSKDGISTLLTLMDGVFTSKYKRMFLMTTNKVWLPDTLQSRPSRIRYIKDFTDLSTENIKEILTDLVKNKKLIPELVTFLSTLENITIDIIKTLAEEINIFDKVDEEFLEIFNVVKAKPKQDFYLIDSKGKEQLLDNTSPYKIESIYPGMNIRFGNNRMFYITGIDHESRELTVEDKIVKKEFKILVKDKVSIHESVQHLVF